MKNITVTMQVNYNGWSSAEDGTADTDLCIQIDHILPNVTSECYDETGYLIGDPDDYEDQIREAVSDIVKFEHTLTIEYDKIST